MGILFVILLAGCGGVGSSWPGLQVAEDILYVADLTHVIAVDARSGQELWRFPPKDGNAGACPGSYHAAPAVLEGWVVIAAEDPGTGESRLCGLERGKGELQWVYPPSDQRPLGPIFAGLISDRRRVFVGTGDGWVLALEGSSGRVLWQVRLQEAGRGAARIWATPALTGTTLIVGTMDHRLLALDVENGTLRWPAPFQTRGAIAGALTLDGNELYVGAFDDHLYAVDPATGQERWRFRAKHWVWDGPAVAGDQLIVGDMSGQGLALDRQGRSLWVRPFQANGPIRARPLIIGNRVYIADEAGWIHMVNLEDGTKIKSVNLAPGRLLTAPVAVADRIVVAPTGGPFRLVAFHPDLTEAWKLRR
ncbi:MAG: PQQ-binding-like beta-propeller repeat protein [Anaerolineae bacterium]|nr:PQQ-binding-like beta-propeller repeat protein [Anaerolineae bacterium]